MTADATFNSRLRVLIAKTYKAEKLYASLRNNKEVGVNAVAELANDVRAKEWGNLHCQLRSSLNDAVSLGNQTAVAVEIARILDGFNKIGDECVKIIGEATNALVETARQEEFAHSLKTALDLVRYKARAQAAKAISSELMSVLEASRRKNLLDNERAVEKHKEVLTAKSDNDSLLFGQGISSNVIPLRRKIA